MSITNQQREHIIIENNTAQSRLLDILENLSRQSTHLTIQEQLHGDIDFITTQGTWIRVELSLYGLVKAKLPTYRMYPRASPLSTCTDNLLKTS